MNPLVRIYIWVQSSPYLHIPIYTNIYAIYPNMVVLFTPQHLHVGGLWYDPIYIIPMVHMSCDYVARHVCPWSSELDPEKIYISPVSPDLTSKSSRDSIVH